MSDVITPDLVRHLEGAPGMYASAVDRGLRPEIARVVHATVEPATRTLRFAVATDTSAAFLGCLSEDARVALVAASLLDYRTFQFKGRVLGVDDASPEDLAGVGAYRAAFSVLVERVGIDTRRYPLTCFTPPYTTVRFEVEAVFDQTPRVGAGALVQGAARASR